MAGEWLKISIILLCINTFMYVGASQSGSSLIEGDILSSFIVSDFTQDDFLNESSGANFGLNTTNVILPEPLTAQRGITGDVLFLLDALDIAFDSIKTFFNFMFVGFVLFKIEGMPYIIGFLIAPVLTLAFWGSIVQLIRGAS